MKKYIFGKNWLAFAVAMIMVFTFVGCGSSDSQKTEGGQSAEKETAQADGSAQSADANANVNVNEQDIYLTLVNKTHELPENWEDKIELLEMKNAYGDDIKVEKTSYEAFQALREDLLKEDVDIELDSCYRSVERQKELWAEFKEKYGEDYCKKYVAVPGFSEHHTGFAIDACLKKDGKLIYDNDEMMKETEIWEKVHEKMPEYGFILHYMEGKKYITGYAYEPWHMRYVGDPAIAKEITEKGITLEEYLGEVDEPKLEISYGESELYSEEDMKQAVDLIQKEFSTWEGCELHSIDYAGDECNSKENIKWMNDLKEGQDYTQCIEFLSEFHSPVKGGGAWEADTEYTKYQWWLARSEGGDWELLTWGY